MRILVRSPLIYLRQTLIVPGRNAGPPGTKAPGSGRSPPSPFCQVNTARLPDQVVYTLADQLGHRTPAGSGHRFERLHHLCFSQSNLSADHAHFFSGNGYTDAVMIKCVR